MVQKLDKNVICVIYELVYSAVGSETDVVYGFQYTLMYVVVAGASFHIILLLTV